MSHNSLVSSRKAQGLSLSTVVIAIIVLVVLVVLVLVFTGGIGTKFVPGVQNCQTALGGTCSQTACTGDQRTLATYSGDGAPKAGCASGTTRCCSASYFTSTTGRGSTTDSRDAPPPAAPAAPARQ